MAASAVLDIRRFNRFYTRQIGVLDEHLLRSQFSLTEVRVLYEIAHRRRPTAAELREDLGLDRGYLSRILRGFGRRGLVRAAASPSDGRQSLLSLTQLGQRTLARLERRSDRQVEAMLRSLTPGDADRLVAATRTITAALAGPAPAPLVRLRSHRPGDMGWVVQRHGEIYAREWRYDERFESLVAGIVARFIEGFDPARERCWIAERRGERIGCIFLAAKTGRTAQLRLLLVEPAARGLGIGRRLVEECIRFARRAGYRKLMLWTQSELRAARAIYQAAGFHRTGQERHDSWGRQGLVAETWELDL